MKELIIILVGLFIGRYLIQWLDILTDIFGNLNTLHANKIQKKINNMFSQEGEINSNVIGFQYEPEEYYEDDEEFEDKKIGFRIKK